MKRLLEDRSETTTEKKTRVSGRTNGVIECLDLVTTHALQAQGTPLGHFMLGHALHDPRLLVTIMEFVETPDNTSVFFLSECVRKRSNQLIWGTVGRLSPSMCRAFNDAMNFSVSRFVHHSQWPYYRYACIMCLYQRGSSFSAKRVERLFDIADKFDRTALYGSTVFENPLTEWKVFRPHITTSWLAAELYLHKDTLDPRMIKPVDALSLLERAYRLDDEVKIVPTPLARILLRFTGINLGGVLSITTGPMRQRIITDISNDPDNRNIIFNCETPIPAALANREVRLAALPTGFCLWGKHQGESAVPIVLKAERLRPGQRLFFVTKKEDFLLHQQAPVYETDTCTIEFFFEYGHWVLYSIGLEDRPFLFTHSPLGRRIPAAVDFSKPFFVYHPTQEIHVSGRDWTHMGELEYAYFKAPDMSAFAWALE